jgi:thiamine biosynthesis protein ThiI
MLVRTVKAVLHGLDVQSVKPLVGRLVVTLGPKAGPNGDEDPRAVVANPRHRQLCPGHARGARPRSDRGDCGPCGRLRAGATRLRIAARRADKRFGIPSPEIERVVGAACRRRRAGKWICPRPELAIGIEVLSADAFFYFRKEPGVGGLPIGTSGRVTCLPLGRHRFACRRVAPDSSRRARHVRAFPQLSHPVAHVRRTRHASWCAS